jgi:hypothetical protein
VERGIRKADDNYAGLPLAGNDLISQRFIPAASREKLTIFLQS